MAHAGVAVLLAGTGIAVQAIQEELVGLQQHSEVASHLASVGSAYAQVFTDSRLGLFLVRNFLSASSGNSLSKGAQPRMHRVSIESLLEEMIELYERIAKRRGIFIHRDGPELPTVRGDPDELKRAIHNVLSNAIKYSYRSSIDTERYIRIRTKVPYDPGFRRLRLGIEFSNYGLGLSPEEQKKAFRHGFRGEQAIREVAVGSGIGLSEVQKIMSNHQGVAKLMSKPVHEHDAGLTYLTTVTLILPYNPKE